MMTADTQAQWNELKAMNVINVNGNPCEPKPFGNNNLLMGVVEIFDSSNSITLYDDNLDNVNERNPAMTMLHAHFLTEVQDKLLKHPNMDVKHRDAIRSMIQSKALLFLSFYGVTLDYDRLGNMIDAAIAGKSLDPAKPDQIVTFGQIATLINSTYTIADLLATGTYSDLNFGYDEVVKHEISTKLDELLKKPAAEFAPRSVGTSNKHYEELQRLESLSKAIAAKWYKDNPSAKKPEAWENRGLKGHDLNFNKYSRVVFEEGFYDEAQAKQIPGIQERVASLSSQVVSSSAAHLTK
ncbi:MAG: hypothetical protein FWE53_00730 [Firmicutes bacterium]|nr:hypothetical protein [Bacillota bacterium]